MCTLRTIKAIRNRSRATLASSKTDAHRKTCNSAADQNAILSDLPRVPKPTPRKLPLARNLTPPGEPLVRNPTLHAPTRVLNNVTPHARAA